MLLCFLAYAIATLTSYTVQFMNCLHYLLDKTMWNQQFGWLATTPKFKGYTYNRLREKVGFQIHDTSLWQLPDSSFWNYFQLFVLWQFRWELWRKGWVSIDLYLNIQLPVDAFNVLGACDKRDDKWFSFIHTIMEYIQDFHVNVYVYHICNNKKIEHQFMPEVDMKRKNLKAGLSPGTQRVGGW